MSATLVWSKGWRAAFSASTLEMADDRLQISTKKRRIRILQILRHHRRLEHACSESSSHDDLLDLLSRKLSEPRKDKVIAAWGICSGSVVRDCVFRGIDAIFIPRTRGKPMGTRGDSPMAQRITVGQQWWKCQYQVADERYEARATPICTTAKRGSPRKHDRWTSIIGRSSSRARIGIGSGGSMDRQTSSGVKNPNAE